LAQAANYGVKDLMTLGRKEVLASVVLRLVDRQGMPDPSSEAVLEVLARNTREDRSVAGLIKAEFMFMTGVLSERVQENWTPCAQRRQALRCLGRLLELLGKDAADPFAPKVMPTLKAGLEVAELQSTAVAALRVLTKKLTPAALRSHLSDIVVALLPCLGESAGAASLSVSGGESQSQKPAAAQDDAVALLAWLIIDRREVLQEAFKDVQELLPPHPALADVAKVGAAGARSISAD
jgi:hypothetical protein